VFADILNGWKELYRDLGIAFHPEKISIPRKVKKFSSLIVVAEGVTVPLLCQAYRDIGLYGKVKEGIVDEVMSKRSAHKGSYACLMCDEKEVGGEFRGIAPLRLKKLDVTFCTIEERMLFGLKYILENGELPDQETITLCVESAIPSGNVPGIDTSFGKMRIRDYHLNVTHHLLRPRVVIL